MSALTSELAIPCEHLNPTAAVLSKCDTKKFLFMDLMRQMFVYGLLLWLYIYHVVKYIWKK